MSGDSGAPECVPGALRALAADPALELILVPVEPESHRAGADRRRGRRAARRLERSCRRRASSACPSIRASDPPPQGFLHAACHRPREGGRADAMVSAGNTGALTAMAHFVLEDRGAGRNAHRSCRRCRRATAVTRTCSISARTPQATALQLAQFATMGSDRRATCSASPTPRVGLLNIGEEETKGHELVQEAHELIRASGVQLPGIRRRQQHLRRSIDVVVTDGFTGNVRAQGDGRSRQAHRRAAAHGVLARRDEQTLRVR